MTVIVKGMKMPKCCGDCPFYNLKKHHPDGVVCKAEIYTDARNTRYDDCPLAEVPTPHGRLMDADEFEVWARAVYCADCDRRKGVKNGKTRIVYGIGDAPCRACGTDDMLCDIEYCPTVIEAEGAGDTE